MFVECQCLDTCYKQSLPCFVQSHIKNVCRMSVCLDTCYKGKKTKKHVKMVNNMEIACGSLSVVAETMSQTPYVTFISRLLDTGPHKLPV